MRITRAHRWVIHSRRSRRHFERWISPVRSELTLTPAGSQSRLWRMVDRMWHGLTALGIVLAASSTMPTPAGASETPRAGVKDAHVRDIDYDPDQVVTVIGEFRHTVAIEFAPGETVAEAGLGDTISWEIVRTGNIIFLKPREKAGPTNLIVVTTENGITRSYHFVLKLGTADTMYGVRFRYPQEEMAARTLRTQIAALEASKSAEAEVVSSALDHAVIEGARNLAYTVQGDPALQPGEISDNGEFTALRYPGHADIPSIFAVDTDGSETIVPYDVREDFVVIHAVYRQLRLRRGDSVLCVYNEAPLRNDRPNRTGTVSGIVERRVKGQ